MVSVAILSQHLPMLVGDLLAIVSAFAEPFYGKSVNAFFHEAAIDAVCFFGASFACADENGVTIHSPDEKHSLSEDLTANLSVQDLVVVDGRLVTTHWNHTVRVWDIDSENLLLEKKLERSCDLINRLTVCGTDVAVSEDTSVLVFDVFTGNNLREFEVDNFVECTIAFGGKIAVGAAQAVHVWDVSKNTKIAVLAHDSTVSAAGVMPCGAIVTGTESGRLLFWGQPNLVQGPPRAASVATTCIFVVRKGCHKIGCR